VGLLSGLMKEELVELDLNAGNKEEVIRMMAKRVSAVERVTNEDELVRAILDRENLESTGIGKGVGIPHARTEAVDHIVLALARSREGVDFNSLDGKPVHLIFLIVAPESAKSSYIKVLAHISRLLRKDEFRKSLMEVNQASEAIDLVARNEIS
jgi:fructose-specific phosphotransferase system IIA component